VKKTLKWLEEHNFLYVLKNSNPASAPEDRPIERYCKRELNLFAKEN
jgi:hypothetical protein